MNTTNQLWAELSPHLFHLLLGMSVLCLLIGIAISMRQNAAYRGQINLFGEGLPTKPVPGRDLRRTAPAVAVAAAVPAGAAALAIPQDTPSGPAFRVRSEIQTPGGDSMLLRMLFACLPPTHFMLVDRPLGEVVSATAALSPEMRAGADQALENVRLNCVIAEMATLKPTGVVLFDSASSREPALDQMLAAAGVPVQHIEAGSRIQLDQVAYFLREGFGIQGAGYPRLAAA